jgi:hypothetical protein
MPSTTSTQSITKNDSAKGMAMLLAGLFILLVASKYILFSSGLVETPRPGSFLFKIFDFFEDLFTGRWSHFFVQRFY